MSLTVIVLVTVVGTFSFAVRKAPSIALKTGASLTAVTLISRVGVLLPDAPSLTLNVTVRVSVLGVSLVLAYVTARNAACHSASVAVAPAEVSVRVPAA
jgi:hypothetical protein